EPSLFPEIHRTGPAEAHRRSRDLARGSAVHMGRLLRAAGLKDSCIICIDTWLGSSEHFLNAPERSQLKIANGRATFYDDFMRNIVEHGLQDIVVPFSITSIAAAEVLRECNL